MIKRHNGSSGAPLSEVSSAWDKRRHFNPPFTRLHQALMLFSSNNPGSSVPGLSRQSNYCDGQIRSQLKNSSPSVSPAHKHARATALQKYHCEYFRITKSNLGQASIIYCRVFIPQDSVESNLFVMWESHQCLNWVLHLEITLTGQ